MTDSKREHFAIIPNIVFHLDLTPFELGLYCHIVRTAGWRGGACHKSSRTLAAELNCSTGTISKAKRELQRWHWMLGFKPLIEVQHVPRRYGGKQYHLITVVDVWPENTKYFERERLRKNKEAGESSELGGSSRTVASSHTEIASASDEIKKNCERRSSEEKAPSLSPSPRESLDAPKKDQILKFWQFVQLLCSRTPVEQIPRRELRIIRQLVPVSDEQTALITWWYNVSDQRVIYKTPEYYALARRPRTVMSLLRDWNDTVDYARFYHANSMYLRE